MSKDSASARPMKIRRALGAGALALAALVMVTACATGAPPGAVYRHPPAVPHGLPETETLDLEVEGRGQGEAVFTRLPVDFASVRVSATGFSAALATLWLDI